MMAQRRKAHGKACKWHDPPSLNERTPMSPPSWHRLVNGSEFREFNDFADFSGSQAVAGAGWLRRFEGAEFADRPIGPFDSFAQTVGVVNGVGRLLEIA